jgi:hypothetical protein
MLKAMLSTMFCALLAARYGKHLLRKMAKTERNDYNNG